MFNLVFMEGKQFGSKMDSRKYNLPREVNCLRSCQKSICFPSSALDMKHDKQERIVKLSRDITAESKKIIFLLHRITWWVSRNQKLSVCFQLFPNYVQSPPSPRIPIFGGRFVRD